MRHAFATRFAVVVTLALSQYSFASADSPKVVTAAQQTQTEATRAVSPSAGEFNLGAARPGPGILGALELCQVKNTICLVPGHMTELNLDWGVHAVHIGDEKLIEVTPEEGDNRKLLVTALGITANDQEKRDRTPFTRTNFYVLGNDNKKAVYEVLIENYLPQVKSAPSNTVEIHNKKTLSDSTDYACEDHSGCKLSGKPSAVEAPAQ
jgi:hypothetical protein